MLMKHALLIFFSFILVPSFGQVNTDSLKEIWYNENLPDSIRISSVNKLAWEGYLFSNPDSSFYFARQHFDFARERGLKKEMAVARNTQGTSFYMSGNYVRAIDYLFQSLKIKEELKDYRGIAATLNNIGMIYDDQGDYNKAIDHYSKAILNYQKIPEEQNPDKQILVASYHNLGVLYQGLKNYEKALEYFRRALELTGENKFRRERAYAFSNIGNIYMEQKNLEEAEKYFRKGYEIAEEIEDENGIVMALNNFSYLYFSQQRYSEAISYARRALEMAENNEAASYIKDAAESLYLSYKQQGKYQEALKMYERYISARDSIESWEKKREVIRQEFQYNYERQSAADSASFAAAREIQNLQIAEQQSQLKSARMQRILLCGILLLLAVLLFVGYNGYKRKKEANKIISRQKLEVEEQHEKIIRQHALLEEKSKKIVEFNNKLEILVEQRTSELENSLQQIRDYQFSLAHKIRAPYVTLVGLLNLIGDERFDSGENELILKKLNDTSKRISVVLKEISEELNRIDAER